MIVFKKISYKNFLSVGNTPIEIDLDSSKVTVISGQNGNGKSAIICALYFAIYGKAFRKINKDSLINSINKKNLLVELELTVNGNDYRIRRGIKPNIFEIYVNGNLRPQDANIKDYQKWLQTILKMDERTFRQVITMGSTSFVPFMRLSASERRTVIEDILNSDIISVMNVIAKTHYAEYSAKLVTIDQNLFSEQTKLKSIEDSLATIKNSSDDAIERANNQIRNIKKEAATIIEQIDTLKQFSEPEKYKELNRYASEIKTLIADGNNLIFKQQHLLKSLDKNISFFSSKNQCPYCTQKLDKSFILEKLKSLGTEKRTAEEIIDSIKSEIANLDTKLKSTLAEMNELYEIEQEINNRYSTLENLKNKIKFFVSEKESYQKKKNVDETSIVNQIDEFKSELTKLQKEHAETSRYIRSYETIIGLLKDDGIKTVIIKNYLGIINSLIKKYLNIINYNISFSFDSNFNEYIKSRGRDLFEYNCFSEGERLRIDFCLLFAFRELAKLRSTVNTNLLIIDEQDGRLDSEGISAINQLLSFMNGNIIIISQYPDLYDEISTRTILMEKETHFTKAIML